MKQRQGVKRWDVKEANLSWNNRLISTHRFPATAQLLYHTIGYSTHGNKREQPVQLLISPLSQQPFMTEWQQRLCCVFICVCGHNWADVSVLKSSPLMASRQTLQFAVDTSSVVSPKPDYRPKCKNMDCCYSILPSRYFPDISILSQQFPVQPLFVLYCCSLWLRSKLPPRHALSLAPCSPFFFAPTSLHSHFLRTAKAELKVNWAWWVPRWASSREPASGPWPAAISSAAAFSTSQPPSCWRDSMWELSRGYRAEETQPTKRPASRSNESSSSSQEAAVSWRKKTGGRKCKHILEKSQRKPALLFKYIPFLHLWKIKTRKTAINLPHIRIQSKLDSIQ